MIKRVSINRIETKLNKFIKRNTIAIGFDVSMHSTGVAVIRTTDTQLILEETYVIQVPKDVSELDGIDLFIAQINDIKLKIATKYKINLNMIEDCFSFANTYTN